jgi:ubiquinone/menaquinone biosynthesis C-methylase UbiE
MTKDDTLKRDEIRAYDDDIHENLEKYWGKQYQELYEYGPMSLVETMLSSVGGGTGLDLACGRGDHTSRLYGEGRADTVLGLDISSNQLVAARRNEPDATFVQGDAENLPLNDGEMSIVLVVAGLHHLPNLEATLDEICRILDDDGRLVFAEAAKYNPFAYVYRNFLSDDAHTEGEEPLALHTVEKLLEDRFETVSVEGHFIISPLLPFLSKQGPVHIPISLAKRVYDLERYLLRGPGRTLAANITGIASKPT